MQGVQEKLQRRQALLPVDNRPFLHRAGWILQLLEDDRTKKMRMMPVRGVVQQSLPHRDRAEPGARLDGHHELKVCSCLLGEALRFVIRRVHPLGDLAPTGAVCETVIPVIRCRIEPY